ncbi:MAG TPA: LON peptidase substrate-binding domain-containing protein [Stellaceae bacterium]|nr:LON peptidase substrate-binding domain-containing protein [Stellaceae bacterium]
MSGSPFAPDFAQLPKTLPIFPLTGVLLLPGGRLPLNIFEPRYLAMTRDALGEARMIGMVQPTQGHGDAGDPPVYRRGCAGRMTSWSETDDGRYLITLIGVARFDIVEELPRDDRLYRRVLADWSPYRGDLAAESAPLAAAERERLLAAIKPFFDRHGITADWKAVEASADERLVTTLAMVCPFASGEKQALLDAKDSTERARLLTALMEMAALGGDMPDDSVRH